MSTNCLSHELHGKSIVSVTNGQIIAKVEGVLLDPVALRVAALVTTKGGLGNLLRVEQKSNVIPGEEVQVWGQDVVLVSRPDVIEKIEELPASEQWVNVSEQIKGRDVISTDGTRIGQLSDVVIDLKGRLVGYELSQVFVEGPLAQSKRLDVEATQSLGRDVLIVDMAAIENTDTAEVVDLPAEEPITIDPSQ